MKTQTGVFLDNCIPINKNVHYLQYNKRIWRRPAAPALAKSKPEVKLKKLCRVFFIQFPYKIRKLKITTET